MIRFNRCPSRQRRQKDFRREEFAGSASEQVAANRTRTGSGASLSLAWKSRPTGLGPLLAAPLALTLGSARSPVTRCADKIDGRKLDQKKFPRRRRPIKWRRRGPIFDWPKSNRWLRFCGLRETSRPAPTSGRRQDKVWPRRWRQMSAAGLIGQTFACQQVAAAGLRPTATSPAGSNKWPGPLPAAS